MASNVAKVVGLQRSAALAPTESELNKKIASVKSVWDQSPSVPTTIDSSNDNSKNDLLNNLMKSSEDKKLISESRTPDIISSKVTEQLTSKVDYAVSAPVDSIHSLAKSKTPSLVYSTPTPNQLGSQSYVNSHPTQSQTPLISTQPILLNTISSPPLAETLRPLSGVQQQYQVHNMAATSPAISTPPTLLYNNPVAAHNVYQMDGLQTQLPTVMTQFAHQPQPSAHYGQTLLQHQQNQLNQANIFMAHQLGPSSEQFKINLAQQQSLAKSLLGTHQFVHQNSSTLQQAMANSNWTTPTAQTTNQTASYYQQSSNVANALQAQQHFAFQSQPSLGIMSAQPQPTAAALVQAQSYRTNQIQMARTAAVDAANPMAANFRSMFAGNIGMSDIKLGNAVNQALDNRNASQRSTFNYNQTSNLQQLQQQQQHVFVNQKFGRPILPVYAQQMLGQTTMTTGRPNSTSQLLSSTINTNSSYNTPIQRPKVNRNISGNYVKGAHQHSLTPQPMPHQTIHQVTHQTQPLSGSVAAGQSALSTAQQSAAKMRQEAVRQTQSFFAQSSLGSTKSESQNQSQICAEVSNEGLTTDCVNSDNTIKGLSDNKMDKIE